jgi:hypothetical protein
MATGVEAFLDALPPDTRKRVLALRDVVGRTVAHAEESLLWGSRSYHRPQVGGRVKGAVCQIVVKGGQVRLDFIHGIWLADPCGWPIAPLLPLPEGQNGQSSPCGKSSPSS